MVFDDRTIFAPATLVGESGITVVRISGNLALSIASGFFSKTIHPRTLVNVEELCGNSVHHGYIFDGSQLIDEAVLTVFQSPKSFTGENVVELSAHGGQLIFRKISKLLSKLGAVFAEPGEFSKRAFLNGKMDLVQAEAVADLIRARTEQANKLALKQLSGEFSLKIKELKDHLINYCSLLELELDFAEEGIDLVSKDELLRRLDDLIAEFQRLTETYESGKIIKDGVNLAIVGKPNVGKSSIFNYLLKESRAIVSEYPGTTRDYIEEPLIIGGVQFNLIDTAGIRHTSDAIEREGVTRTHTKIEESDLVLEVEDLSNPELKADDYVIGLPPEKILKVFNKTDIAKNGPLEGLRISALTGENMPELQEQLLSKAKALMRKGEITEMVLTNERHRDCMLKSCEFLVNAKNQLIMGGGNELISYEIRAAMECLTEITGKTSNVDILNNIFSKFCIGK